MATGEALIALWDALDTDVYLVLDEYGNNVEAGQYRSAGRGVVLYVDEIDGYCLLPLTRVEGLNVRLAEAVRVSPDSNKWVFRLFVELRKGDIVISAEGWRPVVCTPDNFQSALRRTIYENVDIPMWDEETGEWYDAE